MFDSNDLVWLIQRLNGVERASLSACPISHRRDLDSCAGSGGHPRDLDRSFSARARNNRAARHVLDRSLNLAQRILMDVFDNLPPDPLPSA